MKVYGGADFKLREISLAFMDETGKPLCGGTLDVKTKSDDPLSETLNGLRLATAVLYNNLVKDEWDCPVMLVEIPAGGTFPAELYRAQGVILSVLAQGAIVDEINISTWRKIVLGKGTGWKGQAKLAALAWAHERGFEGDNHDEAEALCMAEAARLGV